MSRPKYLKTPQGHLIFNDTKSGQGFLKQPYWEGNITAESPPLTRGTYGYYSGSAGDLWPAPADIGMGEVTQVSNNTVTGVLRVRNADDKAAANRVLVNGTTYELDDNGEHQLSDQLFYDGETYDIILE